MTGAWRNGKIITSTEFYGRFINIAWYRESDILCHGVGWTANKELLRSLCVGGMAVKDASYTQRIVAVLRRKMHHVVSFWIVIPLLRRNGGIQWSKYVTLRYVMNLRLSFSIYLKIKLFKRDLMGFVTNCYIILRRTYAAKQFVLLLQPTIA